ncbi:Glycerate dehydrogenase [bioreactor metagenome]|uniref:Glycerate dehydrogenase n=1 Tax=bioreactor metagenome TaxID=1076179 RepID=A0A645JC25_9ZZZZ
MIKIALALGMEVLSYTLEAPPSGGGVTYVTLEELLQRSDYVTLHCPLTPETRHLINRDTIALMKSSAFVINTARGPLIDEAALIEALQAGRLAGAGLDVQEVEPPAEDNPLYDMENVILTPHMGWKGLETRQRLIHILAGNIKAYLAGSPINVVS